MSDCGTRCHFVVGLRSLCHFPSGCGVRPPCLSGLVFGRLHLCVCGQRLAEAQAVWVEQRYPTYGISPCFPYTSHLAVWSHSIIPLVSYRDKEEVLTILYLICKTIKIACAIWFCFPYEKLRGELRRKPRVA